MNEYQRDLYNGPILAGQAVPEPSQLAWLAGFVDGEGTITLTSRNRPDGRTQIGPCLTIPNTSLPNMGRARILLAALVGHDIVIHEHRPKTGHRPFFTIALTSHFDVDVTLRALYPFLVGKWEHAHVVLEFLTIAPGSGSNRDEFRRVRGRDPIVGARYDERHFALVKRIRRLNRRFAPGTWAAERALVESSNKPTDPPGHIAMDPLKRWYKLRCG